MWTAVLDFVWVALLVILGVAMAISLFIIGVIVKALFFTEIKKPVHLRELTRDIKCRHYNVTYADDVKGFDLWRCNGCGKLVV